MINRFVAGTLILLNLNGCSSDDSYNSNANTSDAVLPSDIVMKNISGGSFVMGNNSLLGPQAGDATEHTVTLTDFMLSEAEITNSQYLEFLNAALEDQLIEVVTYTEAGPDLGKQLVIGTDKSSYSGKILYNLDGTRVMKDHDNLDGDNNSFTGVIEPENPLNIAYIGYDTTNAEFYIKDPLSASDFHWYDLCNYYDYTSVQYQLDTTTQLNDFASWTELAGWSDSNPGAATNLPDKTEVSNYPVTFIRWWGAKAFTDYYGVKLPTEAQWEYAAKGGSNFVYAVHDGADVADANWNQNMLNPATHLVRAAKSGSANPYGLYNMGGNVWEWMADNYQAYTSDSVSDPLIEVPGSTTRSWRGGSWNYHQATLETAGRYYDEENRGNDHFGFRVAK
jgi:sulfatase modifying factor 1